MIEIDTARYTKITRGRALALLKKAELTPDRFIAHKDKTYTAKFKRSRKNLFQSAVYEERFETAGGHSVAILKRPSVTLDRGPYITLRFAIAEVGRLGLDLTSKPKRSRNSKPAAVGGGLVTAARDIQQLAAEARRQVHQGGNSDQLLILLDEINQQAQQLETALKAL